MPHLAELLSNIDATEIAQDLPSVPKLDSRIGTPADTQGRYRAGATPTKVMGGRGGAHKTR